MSFCKTSERQADMKMFRSTVLGAAVHNQNMLNPVQYELVHCSPYTNKSADKQKLLKWCHFEKEYITSRIDL